MWYEPKQQPCYGKLFPDVRRLDPDGAGAGAVFGCRRLDGPPDGRPAAELTVDEQQWARCTGCPHYRSCYDLSMAKLAFAAAVGSRN